MKLLSHFLGITYFFFCRNVWNLKTFQVYLLAEKNVPEIRNLLCYSDQNWTFKTHTINIQIELCFIEFFKVGLIGQDIAAGHQLHLNGSRRDCEEKVTWCRYL